MTSPRETAIRGDYPGDYELLPCPKCGEEDVQTDEGLAYCGSCGWRESDNDAQTREHS